jgi:hypothetical protein
MAGHDGGGHDKYHNSVGRNPDGSYYYIHGKRLAGGAWSGHAHQKCMQGARFSDWKFHHALCCRRVSRAHRAGLLLHRKCCCDFKHTRSRFSSCCLAEVASGWSLLPLVWHCCQRPWACSLRQTAQAANRGLSWHPSLRFTGWCRSGAPGGCLLGFSTTCAAWPASRSSPHLARTGEPLGGRECPFHSFCRPLLHLHESPSAASYSAALGSTE